VHLPFRQEAEPLPLNSTLLISASPRPQQQHTASFPLVCIQPGRFQADATSVENMNVSEAIAEVSLTPDARQQQEIHKTPTQDDVLPTDGQDRQIVANIAQRVERMLTLVLGIILFIIAILIVAASFSEQANLVIVHVLHIDIRMEIEYLLQLIQQLHFGG